jgi:DNA end-binding protein Ku
MPINSGILSFGLVAIPVKLYPAIKDRTVRFHLLHSKCGSRVRNRSWCPVCNEVVERDGLVRGFEHTKEKYIQLTEEELDSLEAEANRNIDLKEFVPVLKVDPIYFENAYYLGPDEGGEKPYRLLAEALAKTQRAAVAELLSRGKEQIVIIRPYQGGLVLHGMFYPNEVRDGNQVPRAESEQVTQDELKLAQGLIDQMSNGGFEPEKYKDEYRLRVLAMIDEKMKGHEITTAPQPAHKPGPVIDLMEALKQSMKKVPERKTRGTRKQQKKA